MCFQYIVFTSKRSSFVRGFLFFFKKNTISIAKLTWSRGYKTIILGAGTHGAVMSNLTSLSSQRASKTDAIADCRKANKVYLFGYPPLPSVANLSFGSVAITQVTEGKPEGTKRAFVRLLNLESNNFEWTILQWPITTRVVNNAYTNT